MPAVLLRTESLRISYGRAEAVRDLRMQVQEGQIVTIIGPNGAGETTLLSGLMGLLQFSGTVEYFGETATSAPECEEIVARGITLIPERRELFPSLSVKDNLLLGAFTRYQRGEPDYLGSLPWVLDLFPRLRERISQPAGTLSGGERQMLAMGRALMSKPKLLLMDEPSLGLAPQIVRDIFQLILGFREQGVSCLLVEQNARAALHIADYGYVMESGTFVIEGPAAELSRDPRAVESYLGARKR